MWVEPGPRFGIKLRVGVGSRNVGEFELLDRVWARTLQQSGPAGRDQAHATGRVRNDQCCKQFGGFTHQTSLM